MILYQADGLHLLSIKLKPPQLRHKRVEGILPAAGNEGTGDMLTALSSLDNGRVGISFGEPKHTHRKEGASTSLSVLVEECVLVRGECARRGVCLS